MSSSSNVEVINLGDVTKICRLCLEKNTVLQPLEESPHLEHLRKITILPLELDSKLPKNVCDQCLEHLSQLEQMTRFLAHCKRSQQILKEFYKHAVVGECIVKRQVKVKGQVVLEIIRGVIPHKEEDPFASICNDSGKKSAIPPVPQAVKNSAELTEHNQPSGDVEIKLELDVEYEEFPNDLVEQVQTTFTNETLNNTTDIVIPNLPMKPPRRSRVVQNVPRARVKNKSDDFKEEPLSTVFVEVPSCPAEEEEDFIFQCDQCKYGTDSVEFIVNHTINVHGGTRKVCCPECKQFVDDLEKHKLEFDGKCASKRWQENLQEMCDRCGTLVNVNDFTNHQQRQCTTHFKCTHCDFTADTTLKLCGHFTKKHKTKAMKHTSFCRVCLKHDIPDLYAHRKENKECQFKCTKCDYRSIQKSSLHYHIRGHSDVRKFTCDTCGAAFKYANSLTTHKKLHESRPEFKCGLCPRKFLTKSNMEGHRNRTHLGIKLYKCDYCEESFAYYMTALRHSHKAHPDKYVPQIRHKTVLNHFKTVDSSAPFLSEIKSFKCAQCRKTFETEISFKAHHLKHNVKKDGSSCPNCGYKTTDRREMRDHMRGHNTKQK